MQGASFLTLSGMGVGSVSSPSYRTATTLQPHQSALFTHPMALECKEI